MKNTLAAFCLVLSPSMTWANSALPRSSPEAQGIASSDILEFIEAAEAQIEHLHSLMILRHGHVVAEGWWEPFRRTDPHMMFSLSKSFTATAVGLAVAEGRFSIDDSVLSFFPEDAPAAPSDNLKALRIRDLLAMSSGHHSEDLQKFSFENADEPLTKAFLALPVAHKPGTHFLYNTPGSYMLSAIVQKTTGMKVLDYLAPRILEPLGIEGAEWAESPQGINLGGFGLSVTTQDVARFGQLYLQKGEWQGKQLVPAEWVKAASSRQTSNGSSPTSDWEQGYGYQFWMTRHGLYRGDGAFGQFCIIMQDRDAVVVITSGVNDMGGVMNLVWDHLLDAMGDAPLPEDDASRERTEAKLAHLALEPQSGSATSPLSASISRRAFVLPDNDEGFDSVRLDATGDAIVLVIHNAGMEQRFECAPDEWRRGGALSTGGVEQPVATSCAWTADDTLTAQLRFYETPFALTLGLTFEKDRLLVDREYNIARGERTRPQLVGEVAPD
jgi:CubicO group peptidase (beta-lactamase class C family)